MNIGRDIILTVVGIIGATLLVLAGGIIYSTTTGKQIDAGVTALAGSALGYLGGILTNVTRRGGDGPPPPSAPVTP